jgi:ankyrin repeat protein
MIQPEELKKDQPLNWSPGTGTEVWELFFACVAGDLDKVRRLIKSKPALVRSRHAYITPLYFAVRENRLAVAAFLLERGADPFSLAVHDGLFEVCQDRGLVEMDNLLRKHLDQVCNASWSGEVVAAAIRERNLAKVRNLLDEFPDLIDAGDLRSNEPIHWAVMTRQIEVIDELLSRGADINSARFDGARPIQLANGDYHFRGWRDVPDEWPTKPADVIAHLRSRAAYCDICTACHIGDLERVRQLLNEDAALANRVVDYVSYYQCSGSPLRSAAARGHMAIVKLLLDHGADPNLREEGIAPHGHALYAAAANRHHDIARLLLEKGAYPNPEVESSADALSRAVANSDQPMIELLCCYGAARAAHLLAYHGDVQTAAAAFAANPNLADDAEALANAAGQGHESFVRLMLRYRPDLPSRVVFPSWMVGPKTRELAELLFQHGMDPNQPNWLLVRPLHQFARKGDVESAALFIDRGADLHVRDEEISSTPLGWAAKHGQLGMAKLLLEKGARPNLPDDPPWAAPLAWATRRGHEDVADLLRQHGAV